jgi:hypothetical protein
MSAAEFSIVERARINIDFNTAPYLSLNDWNIVPGEESTNRGTHNNSNYGIMELRGYNTPQVKR